MRLISKVILTATILSVISLPIANADFSDLGDRHPNYEAIIYLQDNGIIEGYDDGTFKPANKVNRAEFLKIIIEGSNIQLDANTATPFADVNHSSWYSPYIKKAYKEGWIVGYKDGTYRPDQTINKVEALKILASVQEWKTIQPPANPFSDTPKNEWFSPYVYYAKTHGFLEEKGYNYSPGDTMTRANISELIYRTITIDGIEEVTVEEVPSEIPAEIPIEDPYENLNFNPLSSQTISSSFYDDIKLDSSFPNTFYQNEVYTFTGEISNGNYETAFLLLDPDNNDDYDYTTFSTEVKNDEFSVTVHFQETGNFNIGIIPGENGTTKIAEVSVVPSLPSATNEDSSPSTPSNIEVKYADDITSIEFSTQPSTIKKITIEQGSKSHTYLSRQNISSLPIAYKDFKYFKETTTYAFVESAFFETNNSLTITSPFSKSLKKSFTATEHTFDDIVEESITTNPPDSLPSISKISFSGTLKTDTQKTAYVIKPNGFVEEIELNTNSPLTTEYGAEIIVSGGTFTFQYTPSTEGTYVVEIVDSHGLPILNHPIYVNSLTPLIPDYGDLHKREFFSGSVNLSSLRSQLLEEINYSRDEHGLSPVSLDQDLNQLAQLHSDDMAENDFFAHVNLDNKTPNDRRLELNIPTGVAENISRDTSIAFTHYGLMRSATHRSNILEAIWTRVGLGIALTDDGYLITTEEFSTNEISQADLVEYKEDLLAEINTLRSSLGLIPLTPQPNLGSAAKYLNDKAIQENQTLTNQTFEAALNTYNVTGSSQAIGRSYNIWEEILSSIIDEEDSITESPWRNAGIDVQLDNSGTVHAIIILNK